jgi:hypothetical protein
MPSERTMNALTMNDNVFVLLEDPLAPMRLDVAAAEDEGELPPSLQNIPHYRTTFLTLSPPAALEQLITQLKARWVPVRQSSSSAGVNAGPQLTIDGQIYSIGTDWIVRVGNVILAGNTVKGILLEVCLFIVPVQEFRIELIFGQAEYLPIPSLHTPAENEGTSEMLSNLLTSVLPNIPDARTVAVTISDAQWEDALYNREDEEIASREAEEKEKKQQDAEMSEGDEDLFMYGDEEDKKSKPGDWTGMERDRRSAFVIMGALKSEGILS